MRLETSGRFQKEYNEIIQKIEKVKDANVKSELDLLVKKLLSEVKMIDKSHSDLFETNKIPPGLEDHRSNLVNIRKQISKKLTDCERAGLID